MQGIPLSRRTLVASLPFLGVSVTVPSAAAQSAQTDAGLEALLARFLAARDVAARFEADYLEPITEKWRAAKASVPHFVTARGYESQGYGYQHLTTNERLHIVWAQIHLEKPYEGNDDFSACIRELVEGWQRREQRIAQLKVEYRIDHYGRRSDHLHNEACSFLADIEAHPVVTLAGLRRKLEIIEEYEGVLDLDTMRADVERIMAGEA